MAGSLGFCWASLQEHDWGVLCGNGAGVRNSHVPQVAVGRVPRCCARGALGEGSGKLLASLGHLAETPKSSWGNHTGFKEYCRLLLFLTPLHFFTLLLEDHSVSLNEAVPYSLLTLGYYCNLFTNRYSNFLAHSAFFLV